MSHRFGHPFLRFPRTSLALTLLLCLPFLWRLLDFRVSSETEVLLRGDQRNLATYEKVRDILGDVEVVVVSLECEEVFSPRGLDAVRRISEAFEREPDVADVKSLTHSYKPVRRGLGFEMVPFVPSRPLSTNERAELRAFCLSHPLVRNVMVAPDARHTLLTVNYRRELATESEQRRLREEIAGVLAPFRAEGFRFRVLSLSLIEEEIRGTLVSDLKRFVPAAAGLLILILWLTFRSWRVLAMVLLAQALMALLLPGLIDVCGFRLNIFSVMLFPMLIGIHLTLLAHLFTAYQRAFDPATGTDPAIRQALSVVLKSSTFAVITTGVGLLSLATSGVSQTREFGLLGALGLVLVYVVTFGPTLALLKLVGDRWSLLSTRRRRAESSTAGSRATWSERLTTVVARWRWGIVGFAGLVVLVSLIGLGMVRTDIRAVEFLGPSSPTRQAIEEMDQVYGGINVVQIEIDSGAPNGVNALPFLRYVDDVHQFAAGEPRFSGVYSYAQLFAMMNQLWEGEAPGSFRLPDSPLLLGVFVLALKSQSLPFLTTLADGSFQRAYLILRTQDMPASEYLALIERVMTYAEEHAPARVSVSAAQGIHSILEADQKIIRSQTSSAALTAGVIGLVMMLLWRSPKLALVCLLANAIPVGLVLAVAGYGGIPLNSITVMVAAISLGIAVDNSIHLITYWKDLRRAGRRPREATVEALNVKGRPIVWAGAILIAVFALFWFSSFPPVVHFGLLSAIAFLGALGSVLVLLPVVLSAERATSREPVK